MKKLVLVMFVATILFMLAGCSGPRMTFNKPGLTTEAFNRDKYSCVQESRTSWSAGGSGAAGGIMIIAAQSDANKRSQELFIMCMEARGYSVHEVTEEELDEQARLHKLNLEKGKLKVEREVVEAKKKLYEEQRKYDDKVIKETINNNDVVIDNINNLMWPISKDNTVISLNWDDAVVYANKSKHAGFSDWRLPNIQELRCIFYYYHKYYNSSNSEIWSALSYGEDIAVQFDFNNNYEITKAKSEKVPVLLVRSVNK